MTSPRLLAATGGLWLLAGLLGAVLVWRQDVLVAFPGETTVLAGGVILAQLVLGGGLTLLGVLLRRARPRLGAAALLLPPVAVLLGLWAPAVSVTVPGPAPAAPPAAGPDIVVVTLDTFRADHLGAIGGGELTPNLDALARDGVLYSQAVTTVPLTAPAHASMWTGLGASEHGLRANGDRLDVATVVPELAAAGYRTGAFLAAHVLDRETGLAAGFHHYEDRWGLGQRLHWIPALAALDLDRRPPVRSGAEVVDRALRWRSTVEGPHLTWIHLYDAHAPYRPPVDFRPDEAALRQARAADRARLAEGRGRGGLVQLLERGRVAHDLLMYAGEIRAVDHLVGRVVDAVGEDAVIIVVGDHGESLTEHDYWFNHGARLFEPSLHVPFLVRWPGRLSGGRVEGGLVSVQDVAGLVRAAAGLSGGALPTPRTAVEATTTGQQARQLGAFLLRGAQPGDGADARQSAALRVDGGKLVSHEGAPVRWFDLRADPAELDPRDVPTELMGAAARVEELLELPPPELSEDQLDRLRALGYTD